ncbi:hypothetical protein N7492_009485 [Penicillium capsulatum]|uniref:Uncharacterized protein n=1 Tax=Penicillium capsulatum TaxID=69766 RepID=A0A9W9HUD4_9EURO|nr:hypothetical protein N7492_009485 [Penicillium capsulatum]KAJ6106875.1 hypothetical protein N7512_010392 [Penicillium capsulatum]
MPSGSKEVEQIADLTQSESKILLLSVLFRHEDGRLTFPMKPDFDKISTKLNMLKASASTMYSRSRRKLEAHFAEQNGENGATNPDGYGTPSTPASTSRKRARTTKAKADAAAPQDGDTIETSPAKKGGHKPKAKITAEADDDDELTESTPAKKRGSNKPKAKTATDDDEAKPAKKPAAKRGRKPKADTKPKEPEERNDDQVQVEVPAVNEEQAEVEDNEDADQPMEDEKPAEAV